MNAKNMSNTLQIKNNLYIPIKRYPAVNAASTVLATVCLPVSLYVPTATFPHNNNQGWIQEFSLRGDVDNKRFARVYNKGLGESPQQQSSWSGGKAALKLKDIRFFDAQRRAKYGPLTRISSDHKSMMEILDNF